MSRAFRWRRKSAWLLLEALPQLFKSASTEWFEDNAQRLGASVAFYALLSLAPVILIAFAGATAIYGQQAAQGRLAVEIRDLAGPALAQTIQNTITRAYVPKASAIATLLGLAALVFAASSIFVELHDAMNTIWHVTRFRQQSNAATILRLMRERFYSFVTVLATGLVLLLSLVMNAWITAMGTWIPRVPMFVISWVVIAAPFATVYRIVPDVDLRWRDVALAAVITALLFMIGKQFIGLYFTRSRFASTYSAAGSPIVVLLWVYYCAQLFFWGAEFSKVYTKQIGSQSSLWQ